jgi:predicted HTH transcriptional regulator
VIHRYPDSVSIANPGGLRISVEDAVLGGISDPRNATLIKLFNMLDIGERSGSGLPDIYAVWESRNWKTPVLEEQFNPDRTILSLVLSQAKNKKVAIKSSDKEKLAISDAQKQKIIEYLTDNKVCKTKTISELLGVTQARVRVLLSQLIADGYLVSEGENKNRTYRLKP